ncbi:MAG: FIG00388595: hypothetical protein [uncultured Campylobacterales bacterium]|uniref:Endonuclease/exonuclease/phosphatase domain-containing protein n=1 Tax=uncultured Campylobacterales bacterium TaxID=352960 RepID=A0A6S6T3F6_9BACT|nr:MAG: FIG00388595: hypothetical protein [uncultured Campylobacterales bacterium]
MKKSKSIWNKGLIYKAIGLIIVVISSIMGINLNETSNSSEYSKPISKKNIRIANYNVENLFDTKKSGKEYKEYIPSAKNWNEKMYKIKLKNSVKVIKDLNADILSLQEIENKNVLLELKRELKIYPYFSISKTNSVIKCAILSKYPITKTHDIRSKNKRAKRTILEAHIKINNHNLILFVNHWKSKRGPEKRRIDYAKALKERLNKLTSKDEFILIGDFNSNYNEFKTFKQNRKLNNTKGITGINHILKTIKNNKLITRNELKDDYLYNLWLELPVEQRFSHRFFDELNTLDNIILPANMFDNKKLEYVNKSFDVFDASYLIEKNGRIKRWWIRRGIHKGEGFSDHLPIYADFEVL